MPQYIAPRSHADRLQVLARAAHTGQMDINAGRNYVTQAIIDTVNNLRLPYASAVNAIPIAGAAHSKEVRERNEAIATLEVWTRDFWDVLKRRIHRLNQPAEVHTFYGLSLDGTLPKPTTPADWLQAAEKCVEGDKNAYTAGYAIMANPSSEELDALLIVASTEADEVAEADRQHDEALAAAAMMVSDIDAVIDDVMEELRFNTRRMDYPSQRRIQRTYGSKFKTLPSEPDDDFNEQVIGMGNSMQTTFSATLDHPPLVSETVRVSDGSSLLTDTDPNGDGIGQFGPAVQGTGTVNYASGAVTVTFIMPPGPRCRSRTKGGSKRKGAAPDWHGPFGQMRTPSSATHRSSRTWRSSR